MARQALITEEEAFECTQRHADLSVKAARSKAILENEENSLKLVRSYMIAQAPSTCKTASDKKSWVDCQRKIIDKEAKIENLRLTAYVARAKLDHNTRVYETWRTFSANARL